MGIHEIETLATIELKSLDSEKDAVDKTFKKVVLAHIIAASRRESAIEERFTSLENELEKTNRGLEKVTTAITSFKTQIENLERDRINKLERKYDDLDRKVLRIVAYAAGISTGISVTAGILTFLATQH